MTDVPTNNIKVGQPKVSRPQPLRITVDALTRKVLQRTADAAGLNLTALVKGYIDEGIVKALRARERL